MCLCWLILQMSVTAGGGPDLNREPGTPSESLVCGKGSSTRAIICCLRSGGGTHSQASDREFGSRK